MVKEANKKPYASPLLGVVSIKAIPFICQSPSGNPSDPEQDIYD